MENLVHIGTNYAHMPESVPVNRRCTFNYCPLCNGWFEPFDGRAYAMNKAAIEGTQHAIDALLR